MDIAGVIEGFGQVEGTTGRDWEVEGPLQVKVQVRKDADHIANDDKKQRLGTRWVDSDESMNVNEDSVAMLALPVIMELDSLSSTS